MHWAIADVLMAFRRGHELALGPKAWDFRDDEARRAGDCWDAAWKAEVVRIVEDKRLAAEADEATQKKENMETKQKNEKTNQKKQEKTTKTKKTKKKNKETNKTKKENTTKTETTEYEDE